jgi:hypothetical protein
MGDSLHRLFWLGVQSRHATRMRRVFWIWGNDRARTTKAREEMTTSQIARLFHARRAGRGKWQAKCPAHEDRMPSLSITEGREGRTVINCHAGCELGDILASVGLRMTDLFAASRMTQELRYQLNEKDRLRALETREGAFILNQTIDPTNRNYWEAAERNIGLEIRAVRSNLFPDEAARVRRNEIAQHLIAEYGFDELMECVPWPKV